MRNKIRKKCGIEKTIHYYLIQKLIKKILVKLLNFLKVILIFMKKSLMLLKNI